MKRIRIGKYLTSFAVIGAVLGVFGVIRQSRQMPKDWRIALIWAIWLFGLALAVADVAKRKSDDLYHDVHD